MQSCGSVFNVPALRFPEFSGEWETKTMLEIAPLQRGFDLPKGNIRPGDIPVVYSNGIMSTHNQSKCIGPGVITGRSGTIGSFTFIPNGPYWPHNTALWVTNFCGNVPLFIYHLYSHIGIARFASGSGVPTLNRNDVHKHITSIPSNLREQNKIASFLSLLDDRIEIQSKIIEDKETLYKVISNRLFLLYADSSTTSKLGDIANLYQPETIPSAKLSDDGLYLVYGANGIIGRYERYNHAESQICLTCRGNTCGNINYSQPFSWITGNAMVINTDSNTDNIDKRFLYHYLKNYNFTPFISGSGQPQIIRSAVEKLTVPNVNIQIQKRIASALDSIVMSIDVARKIVDMDQNVKKYLLENLFI